MASPIWPGEAIGFSDIFHGSNTISYTLWLFNIAMENSPFIDDFPIKTSIYKGFSMAMLNNQMVTHISVIPVIPINHHAHA